MVSAFLIGNHEPLPILNLPNRSNLRDQIGQGNQPDLFSDSRKLPDDSFCRGTDPEKIWKKQNN